MAAVPEEYLEQIYRLHMEKDEVTITDLARSLKVSPASVTGMLKRLSERGLIQQGWKDSHDSVVHQDGVLAQAPIALCEVQGYAFGAWRGAARLAAMRGEGCDSVQGYYIGRPMPLADFQVAIGNSRGTSVTAA